jgi:FtsX-like permease family
VKHRAAQLWTYYVRLAHGDADLAGFDGKLRSLGIYGTYDLDEAADTVQASIRPQVIGWYVLTGLAGLAALAVIGQAMARQTAAERADHPALSALGVRPREFVLLALLRAVLTGAAGAAGAVLAAVIATSAWPALRQARLLTGRPQWQPASVTVAALCATAVFGTSLTHLVSSPELYGAPFQAYFASDGTPGSREKVNGPLLKSLRRDSAMEQLTLGAFIEVNVNGKHVRTIAMTPLRGTALLSVLDGRLPRGDRDILLGVATMRATGARVGGTVRVTVADPDGKSHVESFHVIGRASLNAGTGGLGNGAVMTTSSFVSAQCPAGPGRGACLRSVENGLATVVLVRAAPGAAGAVALARHIARYPGLTFRPAEPEVLVNFGESVNFPLLFAVALSVFGAATLLHLLLVSVGRRRVEAGLLKALGFVRRQVAAAVCWQAAAVALVGIVIGAPAGIAVGRVLWRVFATNFGVVPVAVVEPVLIAVLAAGVLAAANLLAAVPALLAARSRPAQLLRAE